MEDIPVTFDYKGKHYKVISAKYPEPGLMFGI